MPPQGCRCSEVHFLINEKFFLYIEIHNSNYVQSFFLWSWKKFSKRGTSQKKKMSPHKMFAEARSCKEFCEVKVFSPWDMDIYFTWKRYLVSLDPRLVPPSWKFTETEGYSTCTLCTSIILFFFSCVRKRNRGLFAHLISALSSATPFNLSFFHQDVNSNLRQGDKKSTRVKRQTLSLSVRPTL